jgi:branched-chain amino acid transport system ATP-binding protein
MENGIILETHGLSKEFDGLVAVNEVTMQVKSHSLHSIIGPNGAGKTTFFNLISGHLRPTKGQILYKGQDITHKPSHHRPRLGIGRSFQITNIFPNLTVYENVRLAAQAVGGDNFKFWKHHQSLSRYLEITDQVLADVGLEAQANLPALALSHGDKRKLELAILLGADPDTLLLDEPTSGMAREEIPLLIDLIARIRSHGGKTILLVEHKMDVVMNISDHITVMHHGRVLAEGTSTEISTNPEVQTAYLGGLSSDTSEARR